MRRCKLCVKFNTHCWRRTCDQYGGRRQRRRSFTSICRGLCWTSAGYLPVSPRWRLPCTACRIPPASCWYCCKQATNKLQWNREPTLTNSHPYPLSPPQQVSQHIWHGSLGRVTCIWEIIPLTFPTAAGGGERKELFSCSTALLATSPIVWRALAWPGHSGGSFLFDFLIVYFSSRPAAVLHLWQPGAGGLRLGLALGIIYYAWLQVCVDAT